MHCSSMHQDTDVRLRSYSFRATRSFAAGSSSSFRSFARLQSHSCRKILFAWARVENSESANQIGGKPMVKRTSVYTHSLASTATILLASVALTSLALAQTRGPSDPGVRGGAAGAGGAYPGLTTDQKAFFDAAKDAFSEVDTVPDGLGPRFNLDSCVGCHAQPSTGGSAPAVNPQIDVATAAKNTVPSFITRNGPVREARFVRNRDGSPDGGVHALFVITGRSD